MRFLVDECTGPAVAAWLQTLGHEVCSAYDEAPGSSDDELLAKAQSENWILITNDHDFGVKAFRDRQSHHGIVLMRLKDERAASKITALAKLLATHSSRIQGAFVVVSETQVRFART